MKKRIFSLILCLIVTVPVLLTGCSSSGTVSTRGSSATPYTITIYSITNEETTEEGIQQAQDAINEITEYDFNTHIVLKLFTEEEYENALEDDLSLMSSTWVEPEETTTVEVPVETDENGEAVETTAESKVYVEREDIVYPKVEKGQADILLIKNIDQFNNLLKNGDIQPIDAQLIGDNKIITKFVNPTMLNAARNNVDEMIYAIPNNRMVGEYEFLLLRKDLVDKYSYDPGDIHTILQLEEFVNDVKSLNPEYTPVLDTYGVSTLSVSIAKDSLIGSYVGYNANGNTNAMLKVLPTVAKYRRESSYLKQMKDEGSLVSGEFNDSSKAAAIFLKGDYTCKEKYADDYYVNVYKYPTATNENTFDGMYAVSTYTKNVDRCMQIIEYMATNEDFINTFMYGKRDTNYEIDKDDFVTILNHDYSMDIKYVGNQFLLYRNNEMDETELELSENKWALAKQHNIEMVASSYLGFSPLTTEVVFDDEEGMTDSEYTTDEIMKQLSAISEQYSNKISEYSGSAEGLIPFLEELGKEMGTNPYVKAALSKKYKNSPYAKYVAWYKAVYKDTEE